MSESTEAAHEQALAELEAQRAALQEENEAQAYELETLFEQEQGLASTAQQKDTELQVVGAEVTRLQAELVAAQEAAVAAAAAAASGEAAPSQDAAAQIWQEGYDAGLAEADDSEESALAEREQELDALRTENEGLRVQQQQLQAQAAQAQAGDATSSPADSAAAAQAMAEAENLRQQLAREAEER